MDTIKNYLDSLFSGLPQNERVLQAKSDLYSAMEDHYHELLAEGKSEHEAIGAVISEFGSIDELKEALELIDEPKEPIEAVENQISEEEMHHYLTEHKKAVLGLSVGISLTIPSLGFLISFSSLGAGTVGLLAFILFVTLGVGFIVTAGIQLSRLGKRLNDRKVPEKVKRVAVELEETYQRSFMFSLVGGICLCIFSLFPLFFVIFVGRNTGMGAIFTSILIAGGVFLLVYGGMTQSTFKKFTQGTYFVANEDDRGPNAQFERYGRAASVMTPLQKVYWPVIVIIYVVWSFSTGHWGISWSIFFVAGIVYDAIEKFSIKTKE